MTQTQEQNKYNQPLLFHSYTGEEMHTNGWPEIGQFWSWGGPGYRGLTKWIRWRGHDQTPPESGEVWVYGGMNEPNITPEQAQTQSDHRPEDGNIAGQPGVWAIVNKDTRDTVYNWVQVDPARWQSMHLGEWSSEFRYSKPWRVVLMGSLWRYTPPAAPESQELHELVEKMQEKIAGWFGGDAVTVATIADVRHWINTIKAATTEREALTKRHTALREEVANVAALMKLQGKFIRISGDRTRGATIERLGDRLTATLEANHE